MTSKTLEYCEASN